MILIENMTTRRSSTRYGSLTAEQQFQIASATATRHDLRLNWLLSGCDGPADDKRTRLDAMLRSLKGKHVQYLLVPRPLYRGFRRQDILRHQRVLKRKGVTLMIAED